MTAREILKVAAAQYPIDAPASLAAWEDKIRSWVASGAATGADLLVFPEYAAIEQAAAFGPAVAGDLQATLAKVAELAGRRVALHAELARAHGVHILVGSGPLRKTGGEFVNAAQLVTPSGAVGEQEKIIMTPFERDWGISPGGPLRVFDTALARIGIAICYDCEFPLLVRAMAEAGAEVVLVPSCTERVSGYHRVRVGSMARAREHDRDRAEPDGRRGAVVAGGRPQRGRRRHLRALRVRCLRHWRARRGRAQRTRLGGRDDRFGAAAPGQGNGRDAQLRRLELPAGRPRAGVPVEVVSLL